MNHPIQIVLSERQLCELEMLLNGSLAPINTYLNSRDYLSVVNHMKLEDGRFFPMPIYLDLSESIINQKKITNQSVVELCNTENLPLAKLIIDEIYEPDIENECLKTYGSTDRNHPYVKELLERTGKYLNCTGQLTAMNPFFHSDFLDLRKTPTESKQIIREREWDLVVGFQTRNPMHRAHFEITANAISLVREQFPDKKVALLLTPTVGVTQECDLDYFTRVKCYKQLLNSYAKREIPVELILLPLAMRMAGPREALYHALIRRNYGCTHFVIGRDHAGPSYKPSDISKTSFYGPYEAQELASKYQTELEIQPVFTKELFYDPTSDQYVTERQTGCDMPSISGTKIRQMLLDNSEIPSWFSFPDVIRVLRENQIRPDETGFCVYCYGLSGSGKTTLVKALKQRLMAENLRKRQITILDADNVRQHLSRGLGFSAEDRSINVQRIGYVASEIVKHGGICLVANIAPYQTDRLINRSIISAQGEYIQVFVNTPVEICEERDVKGLYKKARLGEINLTGVNDPFETNDHSELNFNMSDQSSLTDALDQIVAVLKNKQLIK